jgi:hypothetical protein
LARRGNANASDTLVRLSRRFITGLHVLLALAVASVTIRRMITPEGVVDTDFTVFRTAWWLILHGQGRDLYDASAQTRAQHLLMGDRTFEGGLMAFLNPPHAALAGLPFGWIAEHAGPGVALAAWTSVNILLLLRLDHLVRRLLGAQHGEMRWTMTIALLAFYPVLYTVAVGQFSLLLAVGALELFRALADKRPRAAAVWLMVLSIKPQLLPPLLLLLVLRRYWRTLGWAAVLAAGAAAICAAALGISIWFDYLRNLHALEGFFAKGTPAYMMNLRGALTRLLGPGASPPAIYLAAIGAWIAAMAALAFVLVRRGVAGEPDLRIDFALTLAVALFFNPHLFPQDAVIWVVALTLYISGLRAQGRPWTAFSAFALSWPICFAVSRILDARDDGAADLRLTPLVVAIVIALVWMTWTALRKPLPALSSA